MKYFLLSRENSGTEEDWVTNFLSRNAFRLRNENSVPLSFCTSAAEKAYSAQGLVFDSLKYTRRRQIFAVRVRRPGVPP